MSCENDHLHDGVRAMPVDKQRAIWDAAVWQCLHPRTRHYIIEGQPAVYRVPASRRSPEMERMPWYARHPAIGVALLLALCAIAARLGA